MDPLSPAARLSNYRLGRLLGSGGMGSVYLAHDLVLDRPVAIKFIAADKAADDSSRRRLIREARAAAALDHPNICTVHEVIDEPGGRACIVMQYVEGQTLAEKLRGGPLDVRLALSIVTDVAAALEAAHRRDIVHRDVKPQNIILSASNRAKLVDFGLALHGHIAGQDASDKTMTSLTTPGVLIGTLPYMSPEQVAQRPLDGRSDLFSLGAVLFECLTGHRPFTGLSSAEIASQILDHDRPAVSALRPELTAQYDELCFRLLARYPDDRFRSAEELLGALRLITPDTHRSHPGSRAGDSSAHGPHQEGRVAEPPDTGLTARTGRALAIAGLRPFRPRRAALIGVVVLLAATAITLAGRPSIWRRAPAAGTILVGVLPFRNDSGNAAHDPVAAGLRRAVARRLESVPSLRVLSLEDTDAAARDQPKSADVARSLGAALVVEGALVPAGPALDVIASLVHPDGNPRPVGRYRYAGNLVDLQRQLADGLVTALSADTAIEVLVPAPLPTENVEAFAEYSQARAFLERPDVPGNLNHAVRLFQSAISKDSSFALAHAGLAEAYWAQYRETRDPQWPPKAMAANLDALVIDPDQAEVRMSLAVMYSAQGRHAEAIAELKKVMELQPGNDDPLRVLADVHIAGAEWDSAIAAAKQAVVLRPSYWRNHSQLGLAYFRAGKYADAAAAYARVVQFQPDSARGYQTLGTALQAAGKNEEALVQYQKAIAIRPSGGTYSNIGTLHFWRGDHRKAAEAYEQAILLAPNSPELHANLGDVYARLNEKAKATQSYRRAVRLVQGLLSVSATDSEQLAALALYQAKLGQHGAAAEAIGKARRISPADGQVLYVAAVVHALAGDRASGCTALGQAISRGASAEEIRHAGELRALTGCAAYDDIARNRK